MALGTRSAHLCPRVVRPGCPSSHRDGSLGRHVADGDQGWANVFRGTAFRWGTIMVFWWNLTVLMFI